MKRLGVVILLAFMALQAGFADDAGLTPQEAYGRFFSSQPPNETIFSPEFLQKIPESKRQEIVKFYTDALGEFKKVNLADDGYALEFAKGEVQSTISINSDNKISGLWLGSPKPKDDSLEKISADFNKLSGKFSLCLLKYAKDSDVGEEILGINPQTPMGVGSAFKLFLLKALVDEINNKKRNWTDIVELRDDWRSFPSGILQEWPTGSRHTLETLAGLMISLSDNTATDHIYNLLGEEVVRKYFPASCKDLYNTGQLLKMKFMFPDKAHAFTAGDKTTRQAILNEMNAVWVSTIASTSILRSLDKPFLINEMEWFITTTDLCKVIHSLRDNHLCRINPATGLVQKKDWHLIGFKGGSEPGVLNYTWILQKAAGSSFYAFSCTINNPEKLIDDSKFNMVASRLLEHIKSLP